MGNVKIVGLSGSLSASSRTLSLVRLAAAQIAREASRSGRQVEVEIVDIGALEGIGNVRLRSGAGAAEEAALRAVEGADLLVAGSPIYKGSYSGLFKHFVDLLDYRGLDGVPVALLATGGSERHALVIEHQLRPLFAFFQARPLGTGVFFTEREFDGEKVVEGVSSQRFDRLVEEAAQAIEARLASPRAGVGVAA